MSRFHRLTIADIRRETRNSVSLGLRIPDELKKQFVFAPGQYLTLRSTINGEDIRRSYSICSALGEEEMRVGIKHVTGGAFSTYANENLKPGDAIEVMPPDGRFIPDMTARGAHLLGIAAGSGITPVLSIAKSVLANDPHARVSIVFGNQTSGSVMFAEELEDLKNKYLGRFTLIHILSREAQDVPLLSGRITAEKLRILAQGVLDLGQVDQAFLCGPEGMVSEAKTALTALGMHADKIRTELFTPADRRSNWKPPQDADAAAKIIAQVTATLDGKRHVFTMQAGDENLIEAAARAGIELPYSCKGGMCCTCRCKVESGHADMAQNFSLEEWELKAGFILGCQSRPTTPELTVDFDQI